MHDRNHPAAAIRRHTAPLARCLLAALLAAPAALAGDHAKDLKVAARALGFVADQPKGELPVAVLFAPDNPASRADADQLMEAMGGGLKSGAITLVPALVPVNRLEGLAGKRVALLAGGLEGNFDAIFAAASGKGVITIAFDGACARVQRCVMAVTSEPRVEILVSRAAAEKSAVSFAPAFRMMITEI